MLNNLWDVFDRLRHLSITRLMSLETIQSTTVYLLNYLNVIFNSNCIAANFNPEYALENEPMISLLRVFGPDHWTRFSARCLWGAATYFDRSLDRSGEWGWLLSGWCRPAQFHRGRGPLWQEDKSSCLYRREPPRRCTYTEKLSWKPVTKCKRNQFNLTNKWTTLPSKETSSYSSFKIMCQKYDSFSDAQSSKNYNSRGCKFSSWLRRLVRHHTSEEICFFKVRYPRPLFCLFSVFSKQTSIQYYNKLMWKNVHPVYGTWIWTHDLQNVSLLP